MELGHDTGGLARARAFYCFPPGLSGFFLLASSAPRRVTSSPLPFTAAVVWVSEPTTKQMLRMLITIFTLLFLGSSVTNIIEKQYWSVRAEPEDGRLPGGVRRAFPGPPPLQLTTPRRPLTTTKMI